MPRYDFKCDICSAVVEVERSIENRNRPPHRCTREYTMDGSGPLVECAGKYIRLWTPVPFRVDRQ